MTTRQSRDLLDWFRQYARSKFTAIGYTADASNMNLALNSDTRVQAAINYLTAREAELWAQVTPAVDVAYGTACPDVWDDGDGIRTTMPANVAALYDAMLADPDPNAKLLLKTLVRVLLLAVAISMAGV